MGKVSCFLVDLKIKERGEGDCSRTFLKRVYLKIILILLAVSLGISNDSRGFFFFLPLRTPFAHFPGRLYIFK